MTTATITEQRIAATVTETTIAATVTETTIAATVSSAPGAAGPGLPAGGAVGQVPRKASTTDYDTAWDTLDAADVGADPAGTAAAAVATEAAARASADSTHAALTTSAHGGIVASSDARLSDARTPTAHASSHAAAGGDPLTLAQSQISSLVADLAAKVPASRTLTINGTALDLSADRAWTIAAGVTSVGASSPLASSGGATPTISIADQSANRVLAGPASGAAAAPTFRALVAADLPSITSGMSGVLPPANGGSGAANSGNLAWPSGGGTAALLGTANIFTAAQTIALADSATNTKSTLATLGHNNGSGGTPANGFGSRLVWNLHSDTTQDRAAAAIEVAWATAADATRRSQISIYGVPVGSSTLTEYAQFGAAGAQLWSRAANVTGLAVTVSDAAGGAGVSIDSASTSSVGFDVTMSAGANAGLRVGNRKNSTEILTVIQIDRRPGGGSATGNIGSRLAFTGSSSTSTQVSMGAFQVAWNDYTHASRSSYFAFQSADYNNTAREFLRGSANGSAATLSFLGATPIARQTVAADATDLASAITLVNDIKAKLGATSGFGLFT